MNVKQDPESVRYPIMLNKHELVELFRYGQFPAAFMERVMGEWDIQAQAKT